MVKGNTKSKDVSRRQFITGAGAVVITGAIAGLAACSPTEQEGQEQGQQQQTPAVPVSGLVTHDPTVCAGCGVCTLMCSLQHEGEQGPSLSRSQIVRDPFNADFTFNVCQQCSSPSCYFACPLKDKALCVDEKTGATYVNIDECDGCGKCISACPFTPARINIRAEKNVAVVCDLCKDRDMGPICVEYCPMKALTYIRKEER